MANPKGTMVRWLGGTKLYKTHVPESHLYFRYLSFFYVYIAAARQMKISPLRREEWRADRPHTLQESSSMPFFAEERSTVQQAK